MTSLILPRLAEADSDLVFHRILFPVPLTDYFDLLSNIIIKSVGVDQLGLFPHEIDDLEPLPVNDLFQFFEPTQASFDIGSQNIRPNLTQSAPPPVVIRGASLRKIRFFKSFLNVTLKATTMPVTENFIGLPALQNEIERIVFVVTQTNVV